MTKRINCLTLNVSSNIWLKEREQIGQMRQKHTIISKQKQANYENAERIFGWLPKTSEGAHEHTCPPPKIKLLFTTRNKCSIELPN